MLTEYGSETLELSLLVIRGHEGQWKSHWLQPGSLSSMVEPANVIGLAASCGFYQ